VYVTVRENADGTLSWFYANTPGGDGTVIKRTAGDIVYTLDESPGFEFCAPPEVDNDPTNQLINPSFTATTATVTDVHTAATDVAMSLYLFVKGPNGTVYKSPDPEVINTDGT
jgi:hypothetical protein